MRNEFDKVALSHEIVQACKDEAYEDRQHVLALKKDLKNRIYLIRRSQEKSKKSQKLLQFRQQILKQDEDSLIKVIRSQE